MRTLAWAAVALATALVASGCGGGSGSSSDLPSFGSTQAVVDALAAGGVECTGGQPTTDPVVFGREGAREALNCWVRGDQRDSTSLAITVWDGSADAATIEDYHRVTHCSRIDSIAYVVGADWNVLLSINGGAQDVGLAERAAEATGGELRTVDC